MAPSASLVGRIELALCIVALCIDAVCIVFFVKWNDIILIKGWWDVPLCMVPAYFDNLLWIQLTLRRVLQNILVLLVHL